MPAITAQRAERPLVLTLDAGTSWVRAGIHDALARPVEGWQARREHPTVFVAGGGVEKDPQRTLALVTEVIDEVLAEAGRAAQDIAAVSMAVLASSVVGVDFSGRPLTPIYLYSDTRPAAEVETLKQRLDGRAVHQRTGCPLHTSYLPARFLWLALHEPAASSSVELWLALPDFIYQRLFGRTTTSFSVASWSGLLDRATLRWDGELLEILQVDPQRLPPVSEQPLTGLLEPYASRWPALARVPWFPAYADGAASNVGSGCVDPGTIALSLSTTAALRAVSDSDPPELPAALWSYRLDAERQLVGGAVNEGGGLMRWADEVLRLDSTTEQDAAAMTPDSHGLTILPFLTGERSPGWQPQLRGVVAGLQPGSQPEHLVRALMESAAYRLWHVSQSLAQTGFPAKRLRANGGAAEEYPTWLQIIADVLGVTIEVSGEREATSRGAAVLVLQRLGHTDLPAAGLSEERFEPDASRAEVYAEAARRQSNLYARLVDWFDPE